MPIKILNPLLIDNVLTELFDVPINLLSSLMKQALVVDTMDDEFVTRRSVNLEEGYCLTGLEAVLYLYEKKKVHHPLLKEEDIKTAYRVYDAMLEWWGNFNLDIPTWYKGVL